MALPLVLLRDIVISKRSFWRKLGYLILLIFFTVTWWNGYRDIIRFANRSLFDLGVIDRLIPHLIRGTSMLPTLQDGQNVVLSSPKKFGIDRGDIVTFHNLETGNLSYIKRVVGLENDQVVLKNGLVSLNGRLLKENYIFEQKPTYGNTFIADCESLIIPKGYLMVFGDNRTVSQDSRVIGFINKDDVEGVIKTHVSPEFMSEAEQNNNLKATIDANTFLEMLNQKRTEGKTANLVTNPVLNNLAQKRAEEIKNNFNDWKQKGFSTDKLLQQNGYKYNLVHEYVTFGYLSESDVVDQIMSLPIEKEAFLSPIYMEVGIGVSEKKTNECSFPIISVILSWPSTPTYDQKTVDDWQGQANITKDMLNQLQAYGVKGKSQEEVRQIINNVAKESEIASRVANKMKNNEWLSEQDKEDMSLYFDLVAETKKQLNIAAENLSTSTKQNVSPTKTNTQSTSRLESAGQVTVEPGIKATLNSAQDNGNTMAIKVTFANISTTASNALAPIRLSMYGEGKGTSNKEGIIQLSLGVGEIRSLDFTYDKNISPPYTWKYANSSGEAIELGTYK